MRRSLSRRILGPPALIARRRLRNVVWANGSNPYMGRQTGVVVASPSAFRQREGVYLSRAGLAGTHPTAYC